MYIDAGDVVRVRVESDEFHDDEPGPPKAHEGVQQAREIRRPPYTIMVRASPYLHAPLPAASCYLLPRSRVGASWLFGRTDTLRRRRVWFLVFDVGTGLRSDVVVEERRSRNDGRGLRPGVWGLRCPGMGVHACAWAMSRRNSDGAPNVPVRDVSSL